MALLQFSLRLWKNRSIKSQLAIAFFMVAFLPSIVINIYYFKRFNDFIEDQVQSYHGEIVKQAGTKLDSLVAQVQVVSKLLTGRVISSALFSTHVELSRLEKINAQREMNAFLANLRSTYPTIVSIYIMHDEYPFYATDNHLDINTLKEQPWMLELEGKSFGKIITAPHEAEYEAKPPGDLDRKVISFVSKVTDFKSPKLAQSIIQIDVSHNAVNEVLNAIDFGKKGGIYVTRGNSEVMAFRESWFVGKMVEELWQAQGISKESHLLVRHNLKNQPWQIVGAVSREEVGSEFKTIRPDSVLVAVFVVLFAFGIAWFLSNSISSPISKIIEAMKGVGQGNFSVELPKTRNKDLVILSRSFQTMVNKINALMVNIIEKEKKQTDAEIKALQAQINPHFLYNTLDVIRGIALSYKLVPIVEMAKALADLFRYSVKKEKDIVSLSKELDSIRSYTTIQQHRFGDRFEIEYDVEERLEDYQVLRLLLQPLVENAFSHGLERQRGPGKVRIFAYERDNTLVINVEDSGLGIAAEKRARLNQLLQETSSVSQSRPNGMGIGLLNVQARIQLHFGKNYGITIFSEEKEGTTIEVRIPGMKNIEDNLKGEVHETGTA